MIPLIDLSRSRDEVAGALAAALEHVGFFIVVNHGVPQEKIDAMFAEAERFHAQPEAAKHAVLMNEHNNGYMAMARYNVRTSRVSEAEARPDMNEAFFIKRERGPDDPLAGRRFAGPNRWPEGLPGFRETVLDYCETVDRLALGVLPALALSLGLPEDWFAPHFTRSQFSFRLSHYPPAEPAARPLRHRAPHGHQFPDLPRPVRRARPPDPPGRRRLGGCALRREFLCREHGRHAAPLDQRALQIHPAPRAAARRPPPLRDPLFLRPQSRRRNPLCAHLRGPGQPAPLAARHL